ncbi:unnamed protein product [Symbiodinium natans]|uniref:Uncharacterized protein n=1 Tax=Symbiodinium natans TaxID=878477 RepID=A0A812RB00_9DINO|nr:unnamed protein product [Symbiodinium natans]
MASIRMRTPSPSPMVSRAAQVSTVVSPARSAGPPSTCGQSEIHIVITINGHPAPVYAASLPPVMPEQQCSSFATPRQVPPGQREMGAASPVLQTPPKESRPSPSASPEPLPNLLQKRKPDTEEPPDNGSAKAGPENRELQAMQQEREASQEIQQQTRLQEEAGKALREHALQEQRLHFEQLIQGTEDAHEQACKAMLVENQAVLEAEKALREHELQEQRLHFEQLIQDQGLHFQRLLQAACVASVPCVRVQIPFNVAGRRSAFGTVHFVLPVDCHIAGLIRKAEKALRERMLQEQQQSFEQLLKDSREQTMEALRLEYEQALEAEKALRERALQEQQLNFEQLLKAAEDARKQTMEDLVPPCPPAASEHRDIPQEAAAVSPPPDGQPLPAQEAAAVSKAVQAGASAAEEAAHFKEALASYRQRYDGRTPDASQLAIFSANMGFPVPFKLAKELLWARRRRRR